MTGPDPLAARLFGYGILYRARLAGPEVASACEPVAVEPADEARALAAELRRHTGAETAAPGAPAPEGETGLSVPFGRCGIDGRPHEHVRLFHFSSAWIDVLTPAGGQSREVAEGETILIEPRSIVRLRAVPQPGCRVLVAFQTEDRTPLHGHAAPLTLPRQGVSADPVERLRVTTAAFAGLWRSSDVETRLTAFFDGMAAAIDGEPQIEAARTAAAQSGSYEAGADAALFERAQALLTADVVDRVAAAEEGLFRFPGMFGAVAPLFGLLPA